MNENVCKTQRARPCADEAAAPTLAPATRPGCSGVSLFECLVALTLIALLTSAAIPSLVKVVIGSEASSIARRLHISMSLARSSAIKRRHYVTVCGARDLRCSDPADWTGGWIVFADSDADGQRASTEPLLWRESLADTDPRLALVAGASADRYVRFGARGFGWPNGTFHICANGRPLRRVVFYRTGRSRIAQPSSFPCPT